MCLFVCVCVCLYVCAVRKYTYFSQLIKLRTHEPAGGCRDQAGCLWNDPPEQEGNIIISRVQVSYVMLGETVAALKINSLKKITVPDP